jgi:hypothetical protein
VGNKNTRARRQRNRVSNIIPIENAFPRAKICLMEVGSLEEQVKWCHKEATKHIQFAGHFYKTTILKQINDMRRKEKNKG